MKTIYSLCICFLLFSCANDDLPVAGKEEANSQSMPTIMVFPSDALLLNMGYLREIAHYNHFQCMDYMRKSEYMNWEVEGIASYFAKDWNKQIPEGSNINSLSLTEDPNNYIDSYWMGYHAFGLAEELG